MSKKEKQEKPKWKFFWKNVSGFGRLSRLVLGGVLIYMATQSGEDEGPKMPMLAGGICLLMVGLLGWDSTRALFKKPTKKAFLRHYPQAETAETAEE